MMNRPFGLRMNPGGSPKNEARGVVLRNYTRFNTGVNQNKIAHITCMICPGFKALNFPQQYMPPGRGKTDSEPAQSASIGKFSICF